MVFSISGGAPILIKTIGFLTKQKSCFTFYEGVFNNPHTFYEGVLIVFAHFMREFLRPLHILCVYKSKKVLRNAYNSLKLDKKHNF